MIEIPWSILGTLASIVFILILTYITARLSKKLLRKTFEESTKFIHFDVSQFTFLQHFISGLIYILGLSIAVYTIPELRALSVSIFAGAGILAIVIGFASQQAFSNIISGIFIAIFEPFRVGDRIKVGAEIAGVVEDITMRHTVIRTFENKRIVIPNAKISEATIENANLGDEKICKFIEFGISYDSDIDNAIQIMQEEALNHPYFMDNRTYQEREDGELAVPVRVIGFGDSSVNLRAWVWARTPREAFLMGCDLNKSIKERFDTEGVEIPFPYRTLVYKKDI